MEPVRITKASAVALRRAVQPQPALHGQKKVPAGQTTVTGLWPFPDGYSLWAGTCNLNDPAASGGTRADPVKPRPGQNRDGTCRAEAGEVDNER